MASKIEYLRMEPADNGFIISYTEVTSKGGKSTYDNCSYQDKKEVFSEEEVDKAVLRLKELALSMRASKSTSGPALTVKG